jgi:hypothetical protein
LDSSSPSAEFYFVFVATNIANAIIVWVLCVPFIIILYDPLLTLSRSFPETKGKSLEEMDAVFGDQAIPHALETKEVHNVKDDRSSDEKVGIHEKESA